MVLVKINGQLVHEVTAAAFVKLAAAFKKATGKTLYVSSGYRSNAEQRKLFLQRYVQRNSGNGPYGDVRWWNGKRYVRIVAGGTVAVPGTSKHESYRAIDIRDSGADAGVTVAGTVRSNWIKNNAKKYGFNPNGFSFGEPWHIEYTGSLTVPAGNDITPIKDKAKNMTTLYYVAPHNNTRAKGKAGWALAGDAGDPTSPANWIETTDADFGRALEAKHGPRVEVGPGGWNSFVKDYRTGGTSVGDVIVNADFDYEAMGKTFAKALLDEQSRRLAE